MSETERFDWICTALDSVGGERVLGTSTDLVSMGMADANLIWEKGRTLRIRFLDGSEALQNKILNIARQWLVPGVELDMRLARDDESADIRVSFRILGQYWSYIGRYPELNQMNQALPTLNLGFRPGVQDEDMEGTTLHEFGHALGLLHEHNHPEALVSWRKDVVYAELGGYPNFWDKSKVDFNVFTKFDNSQIITTDFDDVSVMIYTIPARWTTNGRSFMPSKTLSSGDKVTIFRLYS
jgi:serralysin